jgi:hypothetical protein
MRKHRQATPEAGGLGIGQEACLADGAAHLAEAAGLAQAGTVVAVTAGPDVPWVTYTVHFPGRAGTQAGWTEGSLQPAPPFPPVATSAGEITSLMEAEDLLIERGADLKFLALVGREPPDLLLSDHYRLTSALARACGLPGTDLWAQIGPHVEERVRAGIREHRLQSAAVLRPAPEPGQ